MNDIKALAVYQWFSQDFLELWLFLINLLCFLPSWNLIFTMFQTCYCWPHLNSISKHRMVSSLDWVRARILPFKKYQTGKYLVEEGILLITLSYRDPACLMPWMVDLRHTFHKGHSQHSICRFYNHKAYLSRFQDLHNMGFQFMSKAYPFLLFLKHLNLLIW